MTNTDRTVALSAAHRAWLGDAQKLLLRTAPSVGRGTILFQVSQPRCQRGKQAGRRRRKAIDGTENKRIANKKIIKRSQSCTEYATEFHREEANGAARKGCLHRCQGCSTLSIYA